MPLPAFPRRVKTGDAAAFAGTTPRAIRHYHAISPSQNAAATTAAATDTTT